MGNISTMIKINIPVSTNSFVKDSEYIGFIQFPKKFCGMPFVKALSAYTVEENDLNNPYYESFVEIFDYENVYHYQYRHFRNDGIHSAGVIQFFLLSVALMTSVSAQNHSKIASTEFTSQPCK